MGAALMAEYEDVLARETLFMRSPLSVTERATLLDVFLGQCEWCRVYFGWRPNLPDEADNHLIELAVAGNAQVIVTRNLRDLTRAELHFPQLRVQEPQDFLKELEPWQP
jgi:predicted nucleic acid-binding protein